MEDTVGSSRHTIYIPQHLMPILDLGAGNGLRQRIAAIIDRYGHIVDQHCPSFSRAEWMLVLDACNGWESWSQAGQTLMTGIALEVYDHARINGAGEKWSLSERQVADLVARLRELPAAETMAVIERIERFWRRYTLPTGEALAAAGIRPSSP